MDRLSNNRKDIEQLLDIRNSYSEYKKLIHSLDNERQNDYTGILLTGAIVCNSMLGYILQQKGYTVSDGTVILNEADKQKLNEYEWRQNGIRRNYFKNNRTRFTLYEICLITDALPPECLSFLKIIRSYRNNAVHSVGVISYEMMKEFVKALDFFALWFKEWCLKNVVGRSSSFSYTISGDGNEEYVSGYGRTKDTEEAIYWYQKAATQGIDVAPKYITQYGARDAKTKLFDEWDDTADKRRTQTTSDPVSAYTESEVLALLAKQTELITTLMAQVNKIDERGQRIEEKVDEINKRIQEITVQINAYQALIERQIEKAASEEEIEHLISAYTDECVDRIVANTSSFNEKIMFEQEEKKLILSLGTGCWEKLERNSKTFLVTAKVMYNRLVQLDNIIDYSGVCVLVTKALELEMIKRFYSSFLRFLEEKHGKEYDKYHTALIYENKKHKKTPLKPEKFTMGNIAFALCYKEDYYDTREEKVNNKKELMDYAEKRLLSKYAPEEIEALLKEYAEEVENIRNDYRNPSAHTNELKRVDAEACFDLVLDVEKILKRMLDSFDF